MGDVHCMPNHASNRKEDKIVVMCRYQVAQYLELEEDSQLTIEQLCHSDFWRQSIGYCLASIYAVLV